MLRIGVDAGRAAKPRSVADCGPSRGIAPTAWWQNKFLEDRRNEGAEVAPNRETFNHR